ncbi:MAG: hypothetical protein NTW74_20830 [Acidobacteria bacterium]|nr:hypothetical protein [Acidobacteriota bacterium]
MKTGLYGKPVDVVPATLRSLAEDLDDLKSIAERAAGLVGLVPDFDSQVDLVKSARIAF